MSSPNLKSDSSSQPLIGASVDSVPPLAIGAASPDSPIPEAGIVAGSAESGYPGLHEHHSKIPGRVARTTEGRGAILSHPVTYGIVGESDESCDDGADVQYGGRLYSDLEEGGPDDDADESVFSTRGSRASRSSRGGRQEGDTSLLKGAFNMFKGNVAGGVFLLPMVFNKAGFILGPLLALPVWFMVTDCVFMLLDTKLKINHRLVQTYPQVIGFVFGRPGLILCSIALVSSQILFCLMYFQIFGDTLATIGPVKDSLGSSAYHICTVASLAFILPSTFFSDKMGMTAYVSLAGIVLIGVTYSICGAFSVKRLVEDGIGGQAVTSDLTQIPLFLTSVLSTLEGIPVVLPIENATKKKDQKKVPYMVLGIFGLVMTLYLGMAVMGNVSFGTSLTTTLVSALPDGGFALAARVSLAGIALCTYPLLWIPAVESLDAALGVPYGHCRKNPKAIALRVVVTLCICGVALGLGADAVGLIIAFIGATGAMLLAVLFPPLLRLHVETAMETPEHERSGLRYLSRLFVGQRVTLVRVKCWAYIAIGLVMSGFSLEAFFQDLVKKINKHT